MNQPIATNSFHMTHKIKFYNIPHVTENRLLTGPRVIKTTKFEESRSIMEKKYV